MVSQKAMYGNKKVAYMGRIILVDEKYEGG
jgi:hypothetical protein